jgi:hypothetical protein
MYQFSQGSSQDGLHMEQSRHLTADARDPHE